MAHFEYTCSKNGCGLRKYHSPQCCLRVAINKGTRATEWSFFCLSAKNWDNTSSFNKCSIQKNKKKKFKMKLFFSLPLEKYLFFVWRNSINPSNSFLIKFLLSQPKRNLSRISKTNLCNAAAPFAEIVLYSEKYFDLDT